MVGRFPPHVSKSGKDWDRYLDTFIREANRDSTAPWSSKKADSTNDIAPEKEEQDTGRPTKLDKHSTFQLWLERHTSEVIFSFISMCVLSGLVTIWFKFSAMDREVGEIREKFNTQNVINENIKEDQVATEKRTSDALIELRRGMSQITLRIDTLFSNINNTPNNNNTEPNGVND